MQVVLGCRGVSRCEFRFDDRIEEAGLDCLEVSNQPGMDRDINCARPRKVFAGNILMSSCNGWCRSPRSVAEIAEAPG